MLVHVKQNSNSLGLDYVKRTLSNLLKYFSFLYAENILIEAHQWLGRVTFSVMNSFKILKYPQPQTAQFLKRPTFLKWSKTGKLYIKKYV